MAGENYDPSQVGVPYVRTPEIVITYPDRGMAPFVVIKDRWAVLAVDGTVHHLAQALDPLTSTLDLEGAGADEIPLIDPATGAEIPGQTTTLGHGFMAILAITRHLQKQARGD